MTYTPIHSKQELIIGQGNTVIVSGWTPCEKVQKWLCTDQYAVIGQLYSVAGIEYLLRNLLYNPQCERMIVLTATKQDKNSGSTARLIDFFANKNFEKINLPHDDLEELCESLAVFHAHSKEELLQHIETIKGLPTDNKPKKRQSKQFPVPEIATETFPCDRYGHIIRGETITEAWVKILHRIRRFGENQPCGYGTRQELIDLMAVVSSEPDSFYFPDFLPHTPEFVKLYIKDFLNDSPYEDGVKYTYGQRMRSWFGKDQVEQVIDKLVTEIDSASAVISLWDSGRGDFKDSPYIMRLRRGDRSFGDSDHDHSGSPCLNHIWVRVTNGCELSLTATFRSNDMFRAWVSNAMGLRALQHHICEKVSESGLDLVMGSLITISQSAHIYEKSFGDADRVIGEQYAKIHKSDSTKFTDPIGSFIIKIEKDFYDDPDDVVIVHTDLSGQETGWALHGRNYNSPSASLFCNEVLKDFPNIQPSHALYLGRELERAFSHIQSKKGNYKQN